MVVSLEELKDLVSVGSIFTADRITIIKEDTSGIGYCLYAEVDTKIHDVDGVFRVAITTVDDW